MVDKEEDGEPQHIYSATVDQMVSTDGKSKWRLARFLLPISDNIKEASGIPHTPLLSDIFPHNLLQWPLKTLSKTWNSNFSSSHQKWNQWVHRLAPKYETLWIQVGIRDAIFSSTYVLRYNQEIILGLVEFWCKDTNTFVFPWGEATVTLEDIMVLGGYPLVGDLVNHLSEDLDLDLDLDLERNVLWLEKCRSDLLRIAKTKRAEHAAWIKHFMEEVTSKYEHVAFLSFWLSRYVFPSDAFDNHVFLIAAKLSLGMKVALAPSVLANLYNKLRQTRDAFESSFNKTIVISGHFQLLQLWAFERFPALVLGPGNPVTILGPGEPRIAHWHKVILKLNIPLVRSALRLPENFEWRPYASSFYKEEEQLIFDCLSLDDELLSYIRCIRVAELVGTNGCKEKYLPNRVAMQFGMDQDLPSDPDFLNFNSTGEVISIFIPSRSFQSGVSLRYSNWWKDSMNIREVALKDLLQTRDSRELRTPVIQLNEKEEDDDCPVEYHPNNSYRASKNYSDSGSRPSCMLNRPSKTMRKVFHESKDSLPKKNDSSNGRVCESVGKGLFSDRNTENLQEVVAFEPFDFGIEEWANVAGVGPKNPICIDEDPDTPDSVPRVSSTSSGIHTDLEGRIQTLEKILGVK